ncbi:transcriptional regulator with PAS, ATPase and Fis domain [Alteromonadaceae bacterium 2753L.S.0a.02]|nr:transcriptional regulator with PAS, ATPase and Fis domain [Alteromonadaceae bacterium 2753L.S.0a.02]
MNTITLVSHENSIQDSIDIKDALAPIFSKISLISQQDFLNKGDALNAAYLHIFNRFSFNNHLSTRLRAKLDDINYAHNVALIRSQDCAIPDFLRTFGDTIFWPCDRQELRYRLEGVTTEQDTKNNSLLKLLNEFKSFQLIGQSDVFVQVLKLIKQIAVFDAPVMLQGETGTGKENAARAIHHLSRRAGNGFVPINCATLPDELFESELFGHVKGAFTDARHNQEGLVEIARGGTLFLDEVDSLSQKAQAALLRFLQTQEYRQLGSNKFCKADVRIIAASNANFTEAMVQQNFRSDLFFRLNVLNISIPPLRERLEDIPCIARSLIGKFAREYNRPVKQLSPQALRWLQSQTWPGNVRELENTLLREMLLSNTPIMEFRKPQEQLAQEHLAVADPTRFTGVEEIGFQEAKQIAVETFEKHYLEALLTKTDGNISEASRLCGKERRAIGKMLKKHNIDRRAFAIE